MGSCICACQQCLFCWTGNPQGQYGSPAHGCFRPVALNRFCHQACMRCTRDLKDLVKISIWQNNTVWCIDVSVISLVYPFASGLPPPSLLQAWWEELGLVRNDLSIASRWGPIARCLLVCQVRKFKKGGAKVHKQSVLCCGKGCPIDCKTIRNKKQ